MNLFINIYHCREIPVCMCPLGCAGGSRVCPILEWGALAWEEVPRLVFGQRGACSLGWQLTVGQMMERIRLL